MGDENSAPPVRQLLEYLSKKKIYLLKLSGNLGDDLIVLGTEQLFSEFGIKPVEDITSADVIVVKGGGHVLVSLYKLTETQLIEAMNANPHASLVLMPQSCNQVSPAIKNCLNEASRQIWIYARDQYSFNRMKELKFNQHIKLGIDHDTAIAWSSSSTFKSLRARTTQEQLLIVERLDAESYTDAKLTDLTYKKVGPRIKAMVPRFMKQRIKRRKAYQLAENSGFTQSCTKQILEDLPTYSDQPVRACDLSMHTLYDFEFFCDQIRRASAVATTRLHVGILAAMLEKPTYIYEGNGVYNKLKGVYEYSLAEMPHVKLLTING